jgi:hypothetical protein
VNIIKEKFADVHLKLVGLTLSQAIAYLTTVNAETQRASDDYDKPAPIGTNHGEDVGAELDETACPSLCPFWDGKQMIVCPGPDGGGPFGSGGPDYHYRPSDWTCCGNDGCGPGTTCNGGLSCRTN